ncbi:hypothetical protein X975_12396, partial [Stegodyphus mimosarum]
ERLLRGQTPTRRNISTLCDRRHLENTPSGYLVWSSVSRKNQLGCSGEQGFVFLNPVPRADLLVHGSYLGPYLVKKRFEKFFDVEVSGKIKRISIDRLKPCFSLKNEITANLQTHEADNSKISPPLPRDNDSSKDIHPRYTKAGRRVRFPAYLKDYKSELLQILFEWKDKICTALTDARSEDFDEKN